MLANWHCWTQAKAVAAREGSHAMVRSGVSGGGRTLARCVLCACCMVVKSTPLPHTTPHNTALHHTITHPVNDFAMIDSRTQEVWIEDEV
jgi:hypothetical protein